MTPPAVTTRFLELDGFSVLVRQAGDVTAPPILCLHGGPGLDSASFFSGATIGSPGLRDLAELHRVVAYDQRGCGGSGTPDVEEPLALSRHVDDIEAVRAALGFERPAILAHSFGTVLAILYALRYPEGLSRLILVGGAPTREFQDGYRESVRTHLSASARERLAELQRTELTDSVFRERFRAALPLYFHRPLSPAERSAFVDSLSFSARVNRELAAGLEDYDLSSALPHVRAPALVVYGESDRVVRPEYQLQFRGRLLTARFVAFQESGHFPFLEEPHAFAQVVHYFVRHGR
ncbi:MAG TPA: alpha/beta fold hydrolase [Gemmatimonadota bacterium]|nr:alpha/beta fold hydrolase [Gemmatimonadota bacterium]